MSSSSHFTDTGPIPACDACHPQTNTSSSHPKRQQVSASNASYPIVGSCSLVVSTPRTTRLESPLVPTNTAERLQPRYFSVTSKCQLQAATAIAIVAIQVQLLPLSSNTTSQALLSVSIILQLLAVLLAICFALQVHNTDDDHHLRPLSTFIRLALQVPTVLILTSIVGTGTAFIVGTLETSLGAAVVMSSFLLFGVMLCLLTLIRNVKRVNDREEQQQI